MFFIKRMHTATHSTNSRSLLKPSPYSIFHNFGYQDGRLKMEYPDAFGEEKRQSTCTCTPKM